MDHVLSDNFDEIEYTVRQDIHTTSARLNSAIDDLRAQITPLQQVWTREAAQAYRGEQTRWEQAATALNEILFSLGNAVRDGADDVAATDRTAANAWGIDASPAQALCGPVGRDTQSARGQFCITVVVGEAATVCADPSLAVRRPPTGPHSSMGQLSSAMPS